MIKNNDIMMADVTSILMVKDKVRNECSLSKASFYCAVLGQCVGELLCGGNPWSNNGRIFARN